MRTARMIGFFRLFWFSFELFALGLNWKLWTENFELKTFWNEHAGKATRPESPERTVWTHNAVRIIQSAYRLRCSYSTTYSTVLIQSARLEFTKNLNSKKKVNQTPPEKISTKLSVNLTIFDCGEAFSSGDVCVPFTMKSLGQKQKNRTAIWRSSRMDLVKGLDGHPVHEERERERADSELKVCRSIWTSQKYGSRLLHLFLGKP